MSTAPFRAHPMWFMPFPLPALSDLLCQLMQCLCVLAVDHSSRLQQLPCFLVSQALFLASFLHLGDAPVLLISVQLSSLPSAMTQTWHLEATFKHHVQHHDLVGSHRSQEALAGPWARGRPIPVPSY